MQRDASRVDDDAHESLCRRCGVSCHLAIPINGLPVMVPGLRCGFLREVERGRFACSVYEERFARAPWCHHADDAAPLGYLARDCPYALRGGHRHGKVALGSMAIRHVWPTLLAEIERTGVPSWIDRDVFLATVRRQLPGHTVDLVPWPGDAARLELRVHVRAAS